MGKLLRVVRSLLPLAGAFAAVVPAVDAAERVSAAGEAVSEPTGAVEREVVVVPLDASANGGVRARRGRARDVTNAWPTAVAPACRAFAAKCQAKTATRGDLIALKKFIAASAIDGAAKTNVTKRVRKIYQESRK